MGNLLGIMTHRIPGKSVIRRHGRAAAAARFQGIALYTPQDVNLKKKTVRGHVLRKGRLTRSTVPLPSINLDIGFYSAAQIKKAALVLRSKSMRFAGYGLGDKKRIQSHLTASEKLRPYLLPTEPLASPEHGVRFLLKHESIMLKPINGWGGKGIIRLTAGTQSVKVQRDGKRSLRLPASRLKTYFRRVLRTGRHMMQKWIDIRNAKGNVFDIRALVQKNGQGQWQLTGMAVREGKRKKITSNMKGGGKAYSVLEYLSREFGAERGAELTGSVIEAADYIPSYMEKSYGTRFSELGIDLAADRSGKLWLIEVNIKPGKKIIKSVYGRKAWKQSLLNAYRYARKLARG